MFKSGDGAGPAIPTIAIDDDDDEVMIIDTVDPPPSTKKRKEPEPSGSANPQSSSNPTNSVRTRSQTRASTNPKPTASAADSPSPSKKPKVAHLFPPALPSSFLSVGGSTPSAPFGLVANSAVLQSSNQSAAGSTAPSTSLSIAQAALSYFSKTLSPASAVTGSLIATMDPAGFVDDYGNSSRMVSNWDPFKSSDWDKQNPLPACQKRMTRDLQSAIQEEKSTLIFVEPDETNITKFTALIVGPQDTPYDGGFFLFSARVPPDYPLHPPRVRNMTTNGGQMRFGPNLYADGKVCLSILGTWPGPSWTAAYNILTTLQSIQTLMSVGALRNEPGYSNMKETTKEVVNYDRFIQHETLRIAVLGNLDIALDGQKKTFSKKFRTEMFRYFLANCDRLVEICNKNIHLDGQQMYCWGGGNPAGGKFGFAKLKRDLINYRIRVAPVFSSL